MHYRVLLTELLNQTPPTHSDYLYSLEVLQKLSPVLLLYLFYFLNYYYLFFYYLIL